jgi:DNA-directed RNA polymerase beta subunit
MGELIQNQLRIGLLRMERVVRERMSIREPEQMTPISLINVRPVVAATASSLAAASFRSSCSRPTRWTS